MSIWNWLTLATSYNMNNTIQQYIQSPCRRAGSDYGRNQTIKTTTFLLAIPGCRSGTHPKSKKQKKKLQIEQSSRSRQSNALRVPATVVVVNYEPQGLSNLISKGIKTSKA